MKRMQYKSNKSKYLNNGLEIKKLGVEDLNKIKDFIITQYKTLECKDFWVCLKKCVIKLSDNSRFSCLTNIVQMPERLSR